MAIPEACGLWIEQRVQEELEQRGKTGASLRAIGRQVAAEVEKYFETKVNPGTILTKAARMNKSVSNETPCENHTTTGDSEEIKRQPAKDGTMRGGPRPGAGRKMKNNTQPQHDQLAEKDGGFQGGGKPPNQIQNWREKSAVSLEDETDEDLADDEAYNKRNEEINRSLDFRDRDFKVEMAMQYARMAVAQLECIKKHHSDREKAFEYVLDWIRNHYTNRRKS